ncbi:betaine-aldehyde dehydrogenase [Desulfopila inferna]|uniref:betaine-aldehyde dehydrogenase n=1 Tax=Desulfopila inferna TaxID=468528 RepID=UPI0019646F15|nr:betaine-aldehyde dehydrogenase [Desulfopila inferna]MBM9603281.1 betaine-aldehyde dehydrogenase [Desulfopila inferna]
MIEKKMFINGCWEAAVSGRSRQIINPFNQKVISEVAEGGREDAQRAIAAAREAFDSGVWSNLPAAERGELLYQLAGRIAEESEALAELESLDTGKTLEESRWDMADIAGIFRFYAGLADKDGGEVIESPIPNSDSRVVREPVGVCGQISPWNYPLLQAAWKLAPALAAGCTVVVKPSEITPLTTLMITELAAKLDFPPGVINTVLGPGADVGAELAESHLVDLISFTGGIETGKTIMRAASGNVKKIALELGGKNPNIVFADADIDTAVDYALNGVFFHAGQICSAGARLMLEDSIHDGFVEQLKARMAQIRLGDGLRQGTQMGPLISQEHLSKVEKYINVAKAEGARLELGGTRPLAAELQNGFFLLPTLFTECHGDMRIVQEEVFGPVITVEKFSSEEEAVRLANGTIYGLAAGFWTSNAGRIHRVAKQLRFGTVWVNDFNVYFTQAPWGGYKQSGLGRELGRLGLEEYTEVKHIFQNYKPEPLAWFGV